MNGPVFWDVSVLYPAKAGSDNLAWDENGRLIDVNDAENRLVSYNYDALGRRTELIYPDDSNVTYEYDSMSRLTKVRYNGDLIAQYEYDALGRRTLLALGNGTNTVYEYDIASQLTKLTNNVDDANISFEYNNYDKVGNRKSCKINDANDHYYVYDKLYQLTFVDYNEGGADSTHYYYDKLGNRTSVVNGGTTSYTQNGQGLNQYGTVGGVNYSYDDNGNLTDDGTYDYYYDCENRLTDVNEGASKIASYSYDYRGRRISKTDYTLNPARCTLYCYDEDQVIAEYENGTLVRKFIYGPGIDESICMITVDGETETRYYYHFDGLGSVVALSNETADIVEQYSYDVFGAATIRDANDQIRDTSQYGNPYMFTGRNYDDETGLYYYRARYYKPEIGRFLQTDPIGYVAGLNLYAYVGNNPVNRIDPSGSWIVAAWAASCTCCVYLIYDKIKSSSFDPWDDFLSSYGCAKTEKEKKDAVKKLLWDLWGPDPAEKIKTTIGGVCCGVCLLISKPALAVIIPVLMSLLTKPVPVPVAAGSACCTK